MNSRPALTDQAVSRMVYRIELFKLRGLHTELAEAVADRLADRDYDRDDRRMCIECEHLTATNTCRKQGPVLKIVLQRCPTFSWRKPT